MIRFGVLGCGRIGQVHASTLYRLNGAVVRAVSDAFETAANALADKVHAEVRSSEDIIAASDIDAVAICTPTDTHADLIEAAAKAGKAVFCEKPIHLDVDRVRSCLETVEQTGTALMIGFQRRFDPDFRALKEALLSDRIGKIEQISIISRDPSPPPIDYIKRSGGLFRDMTIHDFDMARFLLETPVKRVLALGASVVDPDIGAAGDVDTGTVLLDAGDAQVVITNSRRATYGYDQRVEVHGEKGMLQAGNKQATQVIAADGSGFTASPLLDFFMERYAQAYANEMRAFLDVIESGAIPPVSGHDGLEALRLADAAVKSMKTGTWVHV